MSRAPRTIPCLAVLAVAVGAVLFTLRPAARELRGDEGTYVAMAASLARDFDLVFDAPDLAWAESRERPELALILQRTGHGVTYSKPILYPLLAAPLQAVFGSWGAALFNLLALVGAVAIARVAVADRPRGSREGSERDALWTFVATGLALVYVPWRMTEALQFALALAGLALTFATLRGAPAPARGGGTAGAILLGLLISLREPNALVALVPVAAAFLAARPRLGLRWLATTAAAYGAVVLLTWGLTGAPNPYKAPRSTFTAETGFPVKDAAPATARFESTAELATSTLGVRPDADPRTSAYAALYFLVGRHTGLVWYFPAFLVFGIAALASADRSGRVALAGFAALALFYLVWMPGNYFGGETFVGNRYSLAALPLLFVAPTRLPGRGALLASWALAFVVAASAFASVARAGASDPTSQSHTHAGLFRLLPYESTAAHLDGRRDRYWAGDFVRFTDPFAGAAAWSFELAAGRPAAELEIATRRPGPIHLLVNGSVTGLELEVQQGWGGWRRERFPLSAHADGSSGGPIRLEPAAAWRRHRFWWSPEALYEVRMVRLRLLGTGAPEATARVRYLGRSAAPEQGFERQLLSLDRSGAPVAGGELAMRLEVANRGGFVWTPAATLPTQVGLRFVRLDGAEAGRVIDRRFALPGPVAPGETLSLPIATSWPAVAGRYRATLDLVLEDVAWFGEKLGEPLARAEIEVSAAPAEEPALR
ncbi:MAG: hypothetical protein AB7P46_05430 [Thermoanaerobaculia bacterium]